MNHYHQLSDFKNKGRILLKRLRGIKAPGRILLKSVLLLFGHFIKINNPENIPQLQKDPLIFAFNHNNSTETLLVAAALVYLRKGRIISFLIDWMFGKIPLLGGIFDQIKPIFVHSKKARWKWLERLNNKGSGWQGIINQSLNRLERNISIGIFPEGSRNKNAYRLKRGKQGLGQIVLQSGVKVLPIGIDYVQRRSRKRIPIIGKMILTIGEPMDFSREIRSFYQHKTQSGHPQPHEKSQCRFILSSRITHQVMVELARLCGKKYLFNSKLITPLENTLKKGA